MTTTRLQIDDMSCAHCVQAVQQALAAVPGVERVVAVRLESGEAEVAGRADAAALVAALADAGYSARERR